MRAVAGAPLAARPAGPPDRWVAGSAAALAGLGAVIAMAGAGASDARLLLAGGALLAAGLTVLLVGDWIAGLPLILLALPLPAVYRDEAVRVAPALVVSAIVIAAWVLRRGTHGSALALGPFPRRATLLLLGAALVSAAFAQHPLPALREIVNLGVFLSLLVLFTHELRADRRLALALPGWIAGLGAACGVAATLQTLGVLPSSFPLHGTSFFRATLGFGWPNEAAMFLALTLPFAAHVIRTARGPVGRTLGALAVSACLVGLIGTFSRGSWLAVVVAPSVLLLLGERRAPLRFWVLAAAAVVALNLLAAGVIYERAASLAGDWVVEQRGALMLAGLLMFRAHPVVGVGPGGFGESLAEFGPQISWLWDYVASPHNAFVHAAAEMGVLGLLAFVAFLGATLLALVRSGRRGRAAGARASDVSRLRETALWAFATACLVSFVEWPFAHGVGQLIMLVAALGLALGEGGVEAQPSSAAAAGSGAAASVAAAAAAPTAPSARPTPSAGGSA